MKKKIFIVEDDMFYASLLKNEILKSFQANVKHFRTGESFLDNLSQIPDVVLLDYNLGSIDGISILKRIKKLSSTTAVIFISGQKGTSIILEALKNGALGYLEKNNATLKNLNTMIKMS